MPVPSQRLPHRKEPMNRPDLEKIAAVPTGPYAMTHTTETALYALDVEARLGRAVEALRNLVGDLEADGCLESKEEWQEYKDKLDAVLVEQEKEPT